MTTDRPPAPDPFYDAVGRVAVEGAAVETTLTTLLLELIDSDTAAVIVQGQSADQLMHNIRAVLAGRQGPNSTRILELLHEAKRLSDLRNHVVHSDWDEISVSDLQDVLDDLAGEATPVPYIAARARRLRAAVQVRTFTHGELIQLARDLERLAAGLQLAALNTLRERHDLPLVDMEFWFANHDTAHALLPQELHDE